MKIGDKVRFIHSKGEGIIKKIINDNTYEVEIEDGFRIPVIKNEIVVVAKEEALKLGTQNITEDNLPVPHDKNFGIFLAFLPFNDRIYSLYLINNSNKTILYSVGENLETRYDGITSGILNHGKVEKIKEYKIADFDIWPEFHVQLIYYKNGKTDIPIPLDYKIKFKASSFYKSKKFNNVLNKEVFSHQIDQHFQVINAKQAETFFSNDKTPIPKVEFEKPLNEVDLHIEKINPQYKSLQSGEILKFQIEYFERQLENAVASGMKEIIFIHGTGNGVLKNNIHKKLSENIFIKYFEDARKEKFGYGATLVKMK